MTMTIADNKLAGLRYIETQILINNIIVKYDFLKGRKACHAARHVILSFSDCSECPCAIRCCIIVLMQGDRSRWLESDSDGKQRSRQLDFTKITRRYSGRKHIQHYAYNITISRLNTNVTRES